LDSDGPSWFNGGNVGIAVSNPQYKLDVSGSIHATSGTCCTSDLRLKQAVRPIENALDRLLSLTGVWFQFDRASHPDMNLPEGRQMGLIAQEVEQVAPELVMTPEGDGFKAIKYGNAIALVIEAMKEQQGEIERLRAENADMKRRLLALERR